MFPRGTAKRKSPAQRQVQVGAPQRKFLSVKGGQASCFHAELIDSVKDGGRTIKLSDTRRPNNPLNIALGICVGVTACLIDLIAGLATWETSRMIRRARAGQG
jgi:hypothetical protein